MYSIYISFEPQKLIHLKWPVSFEFYYFSIWLTWLEFKFHYGVPKFQQLN